jgi:hypothetical protein
VRVRDRLGDPVGDVVALPLGVAACDVDWVPLVVNDGVVLGVCDCESVIDLDGVPD